MRRIAIRTFLVLCVALGAAAQDARLPVPDSAALAPATADLKKELRDELKSKDLEAKRGLAKKLVERAATESDAAKKWALLDQAASLAEEARDVALAVDVAERLGAAFQTSRTARAFASVDAIARGAKETGVLAEAANACVEIVGRALADDEPDVAGKAAAAAKADAKTAKLGGLAARAAELGDLVAACRRESVAAGAAQAALGVAPDDPPASETLGRFLAFGRGRWEEGLPLLAKSSGPIADAAKRDAADAWWDLAQKEKDPLAKARMLGRAAAAYEKSGEANAKARLASITWRAWGGAIALTKDFSKDGPVSLVLVEIRDFVAKQKIDKKLDEWRTKLPRPPEISFGRGEEYLWRLDTNQGVIVIRFFPDTAPKHVANFLYLTELGFFDGLIFHRVIPGFMAQGGCPKKNGSGGPGYTFGGEFTGDRKFDKPGLLAMANTGEPNTDGSQFFLTFTPQPGLNGKHTIFGEIVEGMDVLKKMEAQGTPEPGVPKTPLVVNSARASLR